MNNSSLHFVPNSVKNYVEKIKNLAENNGVNAVIFHILKFCDIVGHHRHEIKELLSKHGIKTLNLERDYSNSMHGQLKTRIEAFLEMLD